MNKNLRISMFMLLLEFITFWMQSFFDYVSIFLPDLKILK